MAQWIFDAGRVRQVLRIEPRTCVTNDDGDLGRVDTISHGDNALLLLLMAPFDGVESYFTHRHRQLTDLVFGQPAEEEQRRQQVVELLEVLRGAVQLKVDLSFAPGALEFVARSMHFLHGCLERIYAH